MPDSPDVQWSDLLCSLGNQVLGTNAYDTVSGTDVNHTEKGEETATGVRGCLTFAVLKYFDAGYCAVPALKIICLRFLHLVPAGVHGRRDQSTHALRVMPERS